MRELAERAREKGLGFLDAPVGASRPAAASGALIFFVGGDEATLAAARPALEAVGSRINALGPVGAGATWKLINNQLIATQIASLAEATNLARKAGFTPEQISSLILGGSPASPIVQAKLPRMLERHFEDEDFALHLMLKDTRYAMDLAMTVRRSRRHDYGRRGRLRARRVERARRQGLLRCRGGVSLARSSLGFLASFSRPSSLGARPRPSRPSCAPRQPEPPLRLNAALPLARSARHRRRFDSTASP